MCTVVSSAVFGIQVDNEDLINVAQLYVAHEKGIRTWQTVVKLKAQGDLRCSQEKSGINLASLPLEVLEIIDRLLWWSIRYPPIERQPRSLPCPGCGDRHFEDDEDEAHVADDDDEASDERLDRRFHLEGCSRGDACKTPFCKASCEVTGAASVEPRG